MWKCFRKIILFIPLKLIKFYQIYISPALPKQCRYIPTCSQYAEIALKRFGLIKGSYLTIKRLLRCHPYFKHDMYDPVPQKK